MSFKFYSVSPSYIEYLSKFDKQIFKPDIKGGKRPYILVKIKNVTEEIPFLIPLTSPSMMKYKNTRSQVYTIPILDPEDSHNDLGLLKINKMIPYLKSEVTDYTFESTDGRRERLMQKQLSYLNNLEASIIEKSQEVFDLVKEASANPHIKSPVVTKYSPSYLKLVTVIKGYKRSETADKANKIDQGGSSDSD